MRVGDTEAVVNGAHEQAKKLEAMNVIFSV
jgi:hypothetical protein